MKKKLQNMVLIYCPPRSTPNHIPNLHTPKLPITPAPLTLRRQPMLLRLTVEIAYREHPRLHELGASNVVVHVDHHERNMIRPFRVNIQRHPACGRGVAPVLLDGDRAVAPLPEALEGAGRAAGRGLGEADPDAGGVVVGAL
jgi:hypothetical protein